MKLSDKAEEILEAMWIAVEEEGQGFAEMDRIGIDHSDPAYAELTSHTLIEVKEGRVYFRPEGKDEGRRTIRRHRLAERLMMDVLNIRGETGDEKACEFEHLLNEGVDAKVCTMLNHPTTCPHGKHIPPGECCEEARKSGDLGVVPLTELKSNEEGEIAYIQTEDSKKGPPRPPYSPFAELSLVYFPGRFFGVCHRHRHGAGDIRQAIGRGPSCRPRRHQTRHG